MTNQLTSSQEVPETTVSLALKIQAKVLHVQDVVHADAAIDEVRWYITALLADGEEFFRKYQDAGRKHDPEVIFQTEESIHIYRREWANMTKWDRAKVRQIRSIQEYFAWLSSKITELAEEPKETI